MTQNIRSEEYGAQRLPRQVGVQSLPIVGDISGFVNLVISYCTRKFVYTRFSCELYQLHFLQLHTAPKTSLTCKGSTSFGPFAMLCCLTSLRLQNDMWLGHDGDDLVKGGWLLYEAWLGGFMGLLKASDAVELEGFISSSCTDVCFFSWVRHGCLAAEEFIVLVGGKGRHMCG